MAVYKLINPQIEGSFNNMVYSKDSLHAAQKMWNKLSDHIDDYTNNFIFTLKNTNDDSISHHQVNENKIDDNTVKVIIKNKNKNNQFNPKIRHSEFDYLKNKIDKPIVEWNYQNIYNETGLTKIKINK
jgi:hypothetical protein